MGLGIEVNKNRQGKNIITLFAKGEWAPKLNKYSSLTYFSNRSLYFYSSYYSILNTDNTS